MILDLLMTTSQIQHRLVDFGFYHIQPLHPSHGQALVTSLSPLSLTQFVWFFFSLSESLISKRHTNTRMHFITHSFSVYSVQIAGVIAEMTSSQIILRSFPWTNTTNPHSLQLAASSHTTPSILPSIHL